MFAGTLDEAAAPTIEVRVYRNDRLLLRESCLDPKHAAAIAAEASDLDHVYLLVDDGVADLGPGDVFLREDPGWDGEEVQPLADQQLPGLGTE